VFLLTIVVTFQLHHCGCMINKCYVISKFFNYLNRDKCCPTFMQ